MVKQFILFFIGANVMKKIFWTLFHKKYGAPGIRILHFPAGILSNKSIHYALLDYRGQVVSGTRTMREAIRQHKEKGLFICHIWG